MLDVLGLRDITLNTSKTANCVHKRRTIKQRYKHVAISFLFISGQVMTQEGKKAMGKGAWRGGKSHSEGGT